MARGEGKADGDRNAGLVIGSVLGTFALAAFLVVAYVSTDDDDPAERPMLVLDDTRLKMRFCGMDHGLSPEDSRDAIDIELRQRGYVGAGDWFDDVEMGSASGTPLDGGCGLIVGHARAGSHFRAIREGTDDLRSCRDDVVAIATCGEEVDFRGTGITSLRAYVMPGVSGAEDGLPTTQRLLQAEAEHVLGRLRLVPGPRVYVETLAAASMFTLSPPDEGCAHFAVAAAGVGMITPPNEVGDMVIFARTLCENDGDLDLLAGPAHALTLSIRRYEPAPGVGVATRVAAQIDDADIVTDIEDL